MEVAGENEATDTAPIVLRAAGVQDLRVVLELLQEAELPEDGVAEGFDAFIVAERNGTIVGAAGIERHGSDVLLRSVVVALAARGSGLGASLVERALGDATGAGARDVYLLTTTAETWFTRHGFRPISREDVPEAIHESVEFKSACPSTATVMVRTLQPLD